MKKTYYKVLIALILVLGFGGSVLAQVSNVSGPVLWRLLGGAISSFPTSSSVGIATTSPNAKLTVQGTAGSLSNIFNVASSTGASLFSVSRTGTTTVQGLNITGTATTTSAAGIKLSGGCFALSDGVCIGASSALALDDLSDVTITSAAYGDTLMYTGASWADMATSTFFGQNLTTAGSPAFTGLTVNGNALTVNGATTLNNWFDQSVKQAASPTFAGATIGTLNGLLKGATGVVSAATAGVDYAGLASDNSFTGKNNFLTASTTRASIGTVNIGETATTTFTTAGKMGMGTTSPTYDLTLIAGKSAVALETDLATSTTQTLNPVNGAVQRMRISTAGITISGAGFVPGAKIDLTVCNPTTGTAGTLTWSGFHTFGTAPTQTTTANQCDKYVVGMTSATSTSSTTGILYYAQAGAGLQ